jgi:peptidyl-prolyl cis-trans isomerase C
VRIPLFVAVSLLAVLSWSCSRQSDQGLESRSAGGKPARDAILAVVGGERITIADFEDELNRRVRDSGMHYETKEQKRALLDEMIEFKLLLQRARAAGYDHDPELLSQFNRLVVGKFKEDHLATNTESATTVSEQDVRSSYQQNLERYATPESVHLATIYFKSSPKATPEKRAEAREHAEAVLQQARQTDSAGFQRLAQRYSDDQVTRYSGGDIGWLARGENSERWGNSFTDAAFALHDAGDFAPLVETPRGFYIIRLIEKKPAGFRPFEQVRDAIAYQVARERQQQRQTDFLEEMKKGVRIETNSQLLENISVPARVSDQAPPALPRG